MNSLPIRKPQIALHQARMQMSQTSSTCEWLERSNNNRGGGWVGGQNCFPKREWAYEEEEEEK